jgi:hypothetical protein
MLRKRMARTVLNVLCVWLIFALAGGLALLFHSSSTAIAGNPQSGFAGGSGTAEDPYFVATAEQLNNVRNHLNAHFRQIADIDLGVPPWSEGMGWIPIGIVSHGLHYDESETFTGSFDGNGFIILNLTINRYEHSVQAGFGLFGFVGEGGVLQYITLEEVHVIGRDWTGALAGMNKGSVRRSSATGFVEEPQGFGARNVGGFVGENAGLISESFSAVDVAAFENFGGLVGENVSGAIIIDCYSMGDVLVRHDYVYNGGGLWGSNSGVVQNCYTTGRFRDEERTYFHSALGNNFGGTVTSTYWNVNAYGRTDPVGDTGKTTTQMKQQATFVDWDFINIWGIDEGISYPYLIEMPQPALTLNYPTGAPGSYFNAVGTGWPSNQEVALVVNGHNLGALTVAANGMFTVTLGTQALGAGEGSYFVTASFNPSAQARFTLDSAAPLREQEGSWLILEIPAGIAFTEHIFLPLLLRPH